ncbi:hypothetical protein H8957_003561 [Semnopithecus entellus]|uniref:Uncharacterized protein n=2 Tax=Rhinopithecus TaxID=542827 RepID=A0A2K6KM11_RHIBE
MSGSSLRTSLEAKQMLVPCRTVVQANFFSVYITQFQIILYSITKQTNTASNNISHCYYYH